MSAGVARPFLETLGLPVKEVDDICYGIAKHYDDDAGYDYENIPEADIIGDADNIDRFDILRVMTTFEYWNAATTPKDALLEKLAQRIERHRDMLGGSATFSTPTSTRMFYSCLERQLAFYEASVAQLRRGDEGFFDSL